MFQKIRVVTDVTDVGAGGSQAEKLAIAIGRPLGATIATSRTDGRAHREARALRLAAALGRGESAPAVARPFKALVDEIRASDCDLVVVGAADGGDGALGPTCERLLRRAHKDLLVVKDGVEAGDRIVVCIDGSPQAYAGLMAAIELGRALDKKVECVAVYDPYLHYTLFNGIVNVLTKEAEAVFKFKDQEKLHEEIIDTGLAKIYQAHLEVARQLGREKGVDLQITLLDGKAFEKVLKLVRSTRPWLLVMGRIGVHSDDAMDIGATSENLLRLAPCHVLVTSS
jgi:nucleotide-binding universal stress UspA family protein